MGSSPVAKAKELIKGCILLNAAGRFKDPDGRVIEEPEKPQWLQAMQAAIQRFVINVSFIITKQPARIRAVLKQVYPISPEMIDDELVDSIRFPAADDNAAEVFYRVIKKNGNGPAVFVDDLLWTLDDMPLALVWGEKDPWIRPQVADRIQALYPRSKRFSIDAGHCPHDEAPESVNEAIKVFLQENGFS